MVRSDVVVERTAGGSPGRCVLPPPPSRAETIATVTDDVADEEFR